MSWDYVMLYGHYGYIHGNYITTAVTIEQLGYHGATKLPRSYLVTMEQLGYHGATWLPWLLATNP